MPVETAAAAAAAVPTEAIGTPAAAGPAVATRLVITSGPKEGLEIELPSEQLAIGRSSESGLVIRDDYTSTHHARLLLWKDGWVVQDLDSTNGTFLDGTRVSQPTLIPLNTSVTIGTTTFELRR
jgi:pSer/pThr/pTyr-binding forkhead associated (FHA) protein